MSLKATVRPGERYDGWVEANDQAQRVGPVVAGGKLSIFWVRQTC